MSAPPQTRKHGAGDPGGARRAEEGDRPPPTSTGRPPWPSAERRRPASRTKAGIAAVIRVSMKPRRDRVDRDPARRELAGALANVAGDARPSRRRTSSAPALPAIPATDARQTIRAPVAQQAAVEQRLIDAQRRRQVDAERAVPLLRRHSGQRLVAGDARVVHDHVHAAVAAPQVRGDRRRRALVGDVDAPGARRRSACATCGRARVVGGAIEADHVRALLGQSRGDRLADAARRAGHQRHLSFERPHEGRLGRAGDRAVIAMGCAGDERRARRQQEAQHRLQARFRAGATPRRARRSRRAGRSPWRGCARIRPARPGPRPPRRRRRPRRGRPSTTTRPQRAAMATSGWKKS